MAAVEPKTRQRDAERQAADAALCSLVAYTPQEVYVIEIDDLDDDSGGYVWIDCDCLTEGMPKGVRGLCCFASVEDANKARACWMINDDRNWHYKAPELVSIDRARDIAKAKDERYGPLNALLMYDGVDEFNLLLWLD